MTITATLYDWLLVFHILAAMIWVGGAILLGALAVVVQRTREPALLSRLLRALALVGPRVLAPATIAVIGLGVWLVLNSSTWDFGQTWVQLALGLFAAAFVVGAAHQSRAALQATRALERGDDSAAFRLFARWIVGYGVIVALLVIAVWDMVFKPGL
jgi:uncharacterized membrane protein